MISFIRPSLTASQLGVAWKQSNGYYELDGLHPLSAAVRGKYLIVSNDPDLMGSMLANANRKSDPKPAVFVAEFDHHREKENFARLTSVVDRPDLNPSGAAGTQRQPQFLSENIASLSETSGCGFVGKDCGPRSWRQGAADGHIPMVPVNGPSK